MNFFFERRILTLQPPTLLCSPKPPTPFYHTIHFHSLAELVFSLTRAVFRGKNCKYRVSSRRRKGGKKELSLFKSTTPHSPCDLPPAFSFSVEFFFSYSTLCVRSLFIPYVFTIAFTDIFPVVIDFDFYSFYYFLNCSI